jgi:hypothetical protein
MRVCCQLLQECAEYSVHDLRMCATSCGPGAHREEQCVFRPNLVKAEVHKAT